MKPAASRRLRSVLAILWRIGLFFLLFGLASAAFVVPVASRLSGWYQTFPVRALLYSGGAAAVAILAATWAMTRFVDRRPFQTIGFSFDHLVRDIGAGLLLGICWLGASVAVLWAAGWVSLASEPSTSGAGLALAGAALAVLLNALAQQLLLCGYIFQTIRARSSFWVAVIVSSSLFSLYHAGAFEGEALPAVNVFLAGALFCLAYGLTGNLWFPTAIHFAWNGLLGPVLGLSVSGSGDLAAGWAVLTIDGPPRFAGGGFGLEGGLAVTLTTAILVAALALVNWRGAGHNRVSSRSQPSSREQP